MQAPNRHAQGCFQLSEAPACCAQGIACHIGGVEKSYSLGVTLCRDTNGYVPTMPLRIFPQIASAMLHKNCFHVFVDPKGFPQTFESKVLDLQTLSHSVGSPTDGLTASHVGPAAFRKGSTAVRRTSAARCWAYTSEP